MFGACVAAALAILLLDPSAPRASHPADFVGLYSEDSFDGNAAYRGETFGVARSLGIGLMRIEFRWAQLEPQPGHYDFGRYDDFVGQAAARGLSVMPVLVDPPGFRAGSADQGTMPPPKDDHDLAELASTLVHRYGPGGAFWRVHRELPQVPVRSWQIWNEPNIPAWWGGHPDPAAYVGLLRTVAPAIRSADPAAEVVSAGLPESGLDGAVRLEDFMQAMYRDGVRGAFDTFAVHPYAATPAVSEQLVRTARQVMNANGDGSPMRVTEFGWATGGRHERFRVDEPTQAQFIVDALERFNRGRAALRLRGVVLFKWRDTLPYTDNTGSWPLYAGLLRADGSAKPSLRAFADAVAHLDDEPPASLRARRSFVAIKAPEVFGGSQRSRGRQLRRQARAGIETISRYVRPPAGWRSGGRVRWKRYDRAVASLARWGIRLMPVFDSRAARFGAAYARRYGRGGRLWRGKHRVVPELPVETMQIGSSRDARLIGGRAGARSYVRGLRRFAHAVRHVDRRMELVSAEIGVDSHAPAGWRSIRRLYRAGGAPYFDTLAVGLRPQRSSAIQATLRRVRRAMNRQRDARGGIRVTRISWAGGRGAAAPGRQAHRVHNGLRALAALTSLRVRGFVYWRWRDPRGAPRRSLSGLLDRRGRAKPALAAFGSAVRESQLAARR
jgi:hypothetical protein